MKAMRVLVTALTLALGASAAVAQPGISTYTVDGQEDADLHIIASTFPNQSGATASAAPSTCSPPTSSATPRLARDGPAWRRIFTAGEVARTHASSPHPRRLPPPRAGRWAQYDRGRAGGRHRQAVGLVGAPATGAGRAAEHGAAASAGLGARYGLFACLHVGHAKSPSPSSQLISHRHGKAWETFAPRVNPRISARFSSSVSRAGSGAAPSSGPDAHNEIFWHINIISFDGRSRLLWTAPDQSSGR
jgi:hypothetical protein